jgi:hypothetical protein
MNLFNIQRAFDTKRARKWGKIYIAVDLHDTVFKGYYQNDQGFKFYQYAEQLLRHWTKCEDIVLIAYTCSHAPDFERVNIQNVKIRNWQHFIKNHILISYWKIRLEKILKMRGL